MSRSRRNTPLTDDEVAAIGPVLDPAAQDDADDATDGMLEDAIAAVEEAIAAEESLGAVVNADGTPTAVTLAMLGATPAAKAPRAKGACVNHPGVGVHGKGLCRACYSKSPDRVAKRTARYEARKASHLTGRASSCAASAELFAVDVTDNGDGTWVVARIASSPSCLRQSRSPLPSPSCTT